MDKKELESKVNKIYFNFRHEIDLLRAEQNSLLRDYIKKIEEKKIKEIRKNLK